MIFLLGLALGRPSIRGHDGILHYVYLRSVVFDGDLDLTNEYATYDLLTDGRYQLSAKPRHPKTNRPSNYYGVGAAVLWSPFYLAGYGWQRVVLGPVDPACPPDERGECNDFSAWLIGLASLCWGALGLALLYRLGRQFCSRAGALTALGMVWLASPLSFYLHFHPSMSHTCAFFAASLLTYLYFITPPPHSQLRWIGIGAASGLVLMVRYQDAFLLLIPVLGELTDLWRLRSGVALRRRLPDYAAALGTLLLAFLPQLLAWRVLHGSAFSGPWHYLELDSLHLTRPAHFWQIFFSSRHGLFYWHPLLLAGLIGLVIGYRGRAEHGAPRLAPLALLVALILHAYLIACWDFWWAGASFGQRMFISTLPMLFLGAIMLQQRFAQSRRRAVFAAVLLCCFAAWNAGLLVQYGAGMIDREESVSLKQITVNQFTRVPNFIWTKGTGLLFKREAVE